MSALTDAARSASALDPALRRILADVAKARGLTWDKAASEWRGPADLDTSCSWDKADVGGPTP